MLCGRNGDSRYVVRLNSTSSVSRFRDEGARCRQAAWFRMRGLCSNTAPVAVRGHRGLNAISGSLVNHTPYGFQMGFGEDSRLS